MRIVIYIVSFVLFGSSAICAQSYPGLILTKKGKQTIDLNNTPALFEKSLRIAILTIEKELSSDMDVPLPLDMAGGYSHEKHKRNYKAMHLAGLLYQLTDDTKYAAFVAEMFVAYAEMFPKLGLHPSEKSYSRGKLFWQCLNDANWMVYSSQAYDCIYDYLDNDQRQYLEKNLFRPYADFLSIGNPKFFNRIHNHSTWGNAAVGMMGLVMNDEELVNRALYGLKLSDSDLNQLDNDGGFIYEKGKAKAGFFAQLDNAFSPDGYYTEGPYYQRYAMLPFMLFAEAINNKKPELKIFKYREGILVKAVEALLQQTDAMGEFYPINDAQKGMSTQAGSVITAVDIAYGQSKNPAFLNAALLQDRVMLDQNGYKIAKDAIGVSLQDFTRPSIELRDGKNGHNGALGILRAGTGLDEVSTVFKYTSQGLGHGHFDKLSYSIYDGDTEVLQDYGAARWVNIDQKAGGRYLKENKTWAKQSIAHNTLVVDQTSHFNGDYKVASDMNSEAIYSVLDDPLLSIISAKENNAYKEVDYNRTVAMWSLEGLEKPLVIDIVQGVGEGERYDYDLPYHYAGQFLALEGSDLSISNPEIMGSNHGYQHLYKEGDAQLSDDGYQFSWLRDNKFYTLSSTSGDGDELLLARIGASDPNFNLRRDPLIIHRKSKQKEGYYLSVLECHGSYSPVTEIPNEPYGAIASITSNGHNADYSIFEIKTKNLGTWRWHVVINDGDAGHAHNVSFEGKEYSWQGPVKIIKL